jgi:hypothetical protein
MNAYTLQLLTRFASLCIINLYAEAIVSHISTLCTPKPYTEANAHALSNLMHTNLYAKPMPTHFFDPMHIKILAFFNHQSMHAETLQVHTLSLHIRQYGP